jgi:hypothetical protein
MSESTRRIIIFRTRQITALLFHRSEFLFFVFVLLVLIHLAHSSYLSSTTSLIISQTPLNRLEQASSRVCASLYTFVSMGRSSDWAKRYLRGSSAGLRPINQRSRVLFQKMTAKQVSNSLPFKESWNSLPCSEQLTAELNPTSDESSPHSRILLL